MLPYTTDQKAKLVKFYFETKSIVLIQRKFKRFFKVRHAPSPTVIRAIVHKCLEKGSFGNLKHKRGAKKTRRTPAAAQKAKEIMMAEPKKSFRRLGQELGCSKATAQRIAATDLKLYPYKITVHQQLEECDENARKRFSAWFLRKCETTAAFVDNVWFSDEAHFHLDGRVNS